MKVIVIGNDTAWNEISHSSELVKWKRAVDMNGFLNEADADVFFNLSDDAYAVSYGEIKKPVVINSVVHTLQLINASANVTRINGWNGFLKRNSWEVAGIVTPVLTDLFNLVQKKIIIVPDEPGFIAARILAMVINEAYYALGENVSTEAEIDIAMKLGTNYPLGPFEWAKEIGIKNIFALLQQLSSADTRYLPCAMLTKEGNKN